MSLYSRVILPRLIDLVMGNKAAAAERAKLVPVASGAVLEVGVGSARNMPHYGSHVRVVYGVDPSIELWDIGRRRLGGQPFAVRHLAGSAEQLPVADRSVDTVLRVMRKRGNSDRRPQASAAGRSGFRFASATRRR